MPPRPLTKALACIRSSMDAIRINTTLDSDTLYLPQVRPLIGKTVEIIVREEAGSGERRQNGQSVFQARRTLFDL